MKEQQLDGHENNIDTKLVCYQRGRTIEELALEEWLMMKINHFDHRNASTSNCHLFRVWPAHLELLRFHNDGVDEDFDSNAQTQSNGASKQGRKPRLQLRLFRLHTPKGDTNSVADSTHTDVVYSHRDCFREGVTLLSSYPRSGNTLLRTLLERITSSVTGSDTRPDRSLSMSEFVVRFASPLHFTH